jgi:tetratricopeptide (TPR) repeat protein
VDLMMKSTELSPRLHAIIFVVLMSFAFSAAAESVVYSGQASSPAAEDGLPLPPVPQSYKNIKERQQREADERNDPNSPERDAYNQYESSAKGLEDAAIEDLEAAVEAAKAAGAGDPKDVEGRSANARAAQDKITNALRNFEAAARDAKSAGRFAAQLKKIGVTPEPTYDAGAATRILDDMRGDIVVPRHTGPGPENTEDEELDHSAAQLEKAAIDEMGQAVKDAQAAGTTDPKDARGRAAKAQAALDHAKRALGNFERARRFARSAEQIRQRDASQKFRENVPYGQQPAPPVPPYGYGLGGYGYGTPRRDEEPMRSSDPWPGGWGPWLTPR